MSPEYSWFWDNLSPGDANQAPYSSAEFSSVLRHFLNADRTTMGVIAGVDNELAVSGASSPLSVATGAAIVLGKLYQNFTTATTIAVPAPAALPRIDIICLESNTAAQTIRIARVAGAEGGGTPALTQTDATWQIPLAYATVAVAGTITLSDVRRMARTPLGPGVEAATLPADIAGGWGTIAHSTVTGVTVNITAGAWLVWGSLIFSSGGTGGECSARIYDTTSSATVCQNWMGEDTAALKYTIALRPSVYTVTAAATLALQYQGAQAADTVYGDGTYKGTGIVAMRIPPN